MCCSPLCESGELVTSSTNARGLSQRSGRGVRRGVWCKLGQTQTRQPSEDSTHSRGTNQLAQITQTHALRLSLPRNTRITVRASTLNKKPAPSSAENDRSSHRRHRSSWAFNAWVQATSAGTQEPSAMHTKLSTTVWSCAGFRYEKPKPAAEPGITRHE
eukprot:TRINITY_DN20055_c0_g1_i2.p1 TRINITY_DN20055_c0_g1~~TRINITY_DN20055_c0_g1_i2.p1  ORF type:complete len:159 (+),score=2.73 TRINITY_DN20055_c0_g1_i2:325-801(+)